MGKKRPGLTTTKIEWADYTWPIVTGCSNGCRYCYAMKLLRRLARMGNRRYEKTGTKPTLHPDQGFMLNNTKKPGVVFVASMGDILLPDDFQTFDGVDIVSPSRSGQVCFQVGQMMKDFPEHDYVVFTRQEMKQEMERMKGISEMMPPVDTNKKGGEILH